VTRDDALAAANALASLLTVLPEATRVVSFGKSHDALRVHVMDEGMQDAVHRLRSAFGVPTWDLHRSAEHDHLTATWPALVVTTCWDWQCPPAGLLAYAKFDGMMVGAADARR